MPLLICTPSVKVKRFLALRAPAALLGPGDVIDAAPVVVAPPLTTMPPGPKPVTNDKLGGYEAKANESRANAAREKPVLNVLSNRGEKICVSRTLATCERSVM